MVGLDVFDAFGNWMGVWMQSFVGIAWVLIPLAGIAWFIINGLSEEKTARLNRELLHRERMSAMEKGMSQMLEKSIATEPVTGGRDPNGLLIGGIITLGVGVGLSAFLQIAVDGSDRKQAVAVGLIPIFVGLSLIVAWAAARKLNARGQKEPQERS